MNDIELETPAYITGGWCKVTGQPEPFGLGALNRKNRLQDYVYHSRRVFNMNPQLVEVILGNKVNWIDKKVSKARQVYYQNLRSFVYSPGSIETLCLNLSTLRFIETSNRIYIIVGHNEEVCKEAMLQMAYGNTNKQQTDAMTSNRVLSTTRPANKMLLAYNAAL